MNIHIENKYLDVLGQINLDDLHISQTFEYYQQCYQGSHTAQDLVKNSCTISGEFKDSVMIGLCNRTMGKHIPKCRSAEGAAIRGSLQRCGLVKSSGHELFRGCAVFPSYDEHNNIVSAIGYRIGRMLFYKPYRRSPSAVFRTVPIFHAPSLRSSLHSQFFHSLYLPLIAQVL